MRTFDGLDLHVCTYGPVDTPLTIMLAHCWTLNHEDWHYQVQALQQEFGHGVRILTWDHRGHGQSSGCPYRTCTVGNLARDMGDLIDELAPTGKLLLAGHSIGGMTIMALAEQRPEILDRVVGTLFVSTAAAELDTVTLGLPDTGKLVRSQIPRILALRSRTLSRRARRRAPILEQMVVRRFLFGTPMRLADAALTVDGLVSSPGATLMGFYQDFMQHHARVEVLEQFSGIPTRVLVGSRDLLTPVRFSRTLAENIEGAELTVAPDAGHMLTLERHELVSEALISLAREHA